MKTKSMPVPIHVTRIKLPKDKDIQDLLKEIVPPPEKINEPIMIDAAAARKGDVVVVGFTQPKNEQDHKKFFDFLIALAAYADEVVTLTPATLFNRKVLLLHRNKPDGSEEIQYTIVEKTPGNKNQKEREWKQLQGSDCEKSKLNLFKSAEKVRNDLSVPNLFEIDLPSQPEIITGAAPLRPDGPEQIFWTEQEVSSDFDLLDFTKYQVSAEFEREGKVMPGALARAGNKILVFKTGLATQADKDAFSYRLVRLASMSDEMCMMTEAWSFNKKAKDDEEFKKYQQMMEDYRAGKIETLEHIPGRTEVVQVIHSRLAGENYYFREIIRKPDGSAELGPWEEMETEGYPLEGRMVNFFRKARPEVHN